MSKQHIINKVEYIEKEYVVENDDVNHIYKRLCVNRYIKTLDVPSYKLSHNELAGLPWDQIEDGKYNDELMIYSETSLLTLGHILVSLRLAPMIDKGLLYPLKLDTFKDDSSLESVFNYILTSKLLALSPQANVFLYKLVIEDITSCEKYSVSNNQQRYRYTLYVKPLWYYEIDEHIEPTLTTKKVLVKNYKEQWDKIGNGVGTLQEISIDIYKKYIDRYSDFYNYYFSDLIRDKVIGYEHDNIFYRFRHFNKHTCMLYGEIIENSGRYITEDNEGTHDVCVTDDYIFYLKKDVIYYSSGRVYYNNKIIYTQDTHPDIIKMFTEFHYKTNIKSLKALFPEAVGYDTTNCSGSL